MCVFVFVCGFVRCGIVCMCGCVFAGLRCVGCLSVCIFVEFLDVGDCVSLGLCVVGLCVCVVVWLRVCLFVVCL